MLTIVIPAMEEFNEATNEFITIEKQTLQLEHSLVALSKWEAKHKKSFVSNSNLTIEETIDYFIDMTLNESFNKEAFPFMPSKVAKQIQDYIASPMTATVLPKKQTTPNREIITSELIYYWMIALKIPMECQTWHLNRLLTLISVCEIKNQPPKKKSRAEIISRNRELNTARQKEMNTRG